MKIEVNREILLKQYYDLFKFIETTEEYTGRYDGISRYASYESIENAPKMTSKDCFETISKNAVETFNMLFGGILELDIYELNKMGFQHWEKDKFIVPYWAIDLIPDNTKIYFNYKKGVPKKKELKKDDFLYYREPCCAVKLSFGEKELEDFLEFKKRELWKEFGIPYYKD